MFQLNSFRLFTLILITVLSNYYIPSESRVKKSPPAFKGCKVNAASLVWKGSPTPQTSNLKSWIYNQKVKGTFFIDVDRITNTIYEDQVKNLNDFNHTVGLYIKDDAQFLNILNLVDRLSNLVGYIPQYIYFESGSDSNKLTAIDMGFLMIEAGFDAQNTRSFSSIKSDLTNFFTLAGNSHIILFSDNEYSKMNEAEYINMITDIRSRNLEIISLPLCTDTSGKLSQINKSHFKQSSSASSLF
eukprot:NODE_141_length_17903_cov_0.288643.p6 type:complete len:243 gc:universal NODE_141_length_17903_cov_0.288643:2967-3695(+)